MATATQTQTGAYLAALPADDPIDTRRVYTYTVELNRCAEFPLDMLRHDDARPATAEDADLIEKLNAGDGFGLDRKIEVTLRSRSKSAPNLARWNSFGVPVLRWDNPKVHAPYVDPDDLRKRSLNKLYEAVLRCRDKGTFSSPTYEALREAVEVAGRDDEWRREALGFCKGVNRVLAQVPPLKSVEAYREALNCAALLLAANDAGMVKGMDEQVKLAIVALQAVD